MMDGIVVYIGCYARSSIILFLLFPSDAGIRVFVRLGGFGDFFFQAEDGIRDLVRSRGLGDVDKRHILYMRICLEST